MRNRTKRSRNIDKSNIVLGAFDSVLLFIAITLLLASCAKITNYDRKYYIDGQYVMQTVKDTTYYFNILMRKNVAIVIESKPFAKEYYPK